MVRKWTHTSAFAHFGARPRNVQWSWSSRSDDGGKVIITLWQDEIRRVNGKVIFSRKSDTLVSSDHRLGLRELMENLTWARDHCGGRVHVIIAIAKDPTVKRRSISECFPSKMTMIVKELDVEYGSFVAEAEGL